MKIFEFSFNPKKRKDRFFGVYSFEPKRAAEKPKGALYVVGELNNALDFNAGLLKRLAGAIQQEYYGSPLKAVSGALKAALKKANLLLEQESKKGNVDWLGNLHAAVLLFIVTGEKKTAFLAAKTGQINMQLARQGMLTDIAKRADASSARKPGKVFSSVASGTLVPLDSVIAATHEVFDVLSRDKSLKELGTLKEARQFRGFFSQRNRVLSRASGLAVSFVIEQEQAKRKQNAQTLFAKLSLPKPRLMLSKGAKTLTLGKFGLPVLRNPAAFKKQARIILLFFALLLLGYLLF